MKIAVTGCTGFVGRALSVELLSRGFLAQGVVRGHTMPIQNKNMHYVTVGDIGTATDWSQALQGVDCVIHCAARAHVMHETATDALAAYRAVNVTGTRRLAEQAAMLGVRRLVYLSSIKVNGERTRSQRDAPPVPRLFLMRSRQVIHPHQKIPMASQNGKPSRCCKAKAAAQGLR